MKMSIAKGGDEDDPSENWPGIISKLKVSK